MQPRIRAGLLVKFQPTVEALGGDVSKVLSVVQQPLDILDDPERYIPYRVYLDLLHTASLATDCPHFGLEMSRELGAHDMGVTGFVMSREGSVGDAWRSLQRFYDVHDTYGTVLLTDTESLAYLRYEIPNLSIPGARQSLDVAAGISTNIHKMITGSTVPASAIHFPYPAPEDLTPYEFLGSEELNFDQPGYALIFPSYCLRLPVASAAAAIQEPINAYLETLELNSGHVTSRQVEALIRDFLPTGNCTVAHTARFLSLSVRTLQNRLEIEHTNFQLLLEKVRRELAINHLSRGDMRFTELADLLGYSELSAFSRSFKRWYGISPKAWQQKYLDRK
jgi:AraC-like DNA-binding protein